MPSVQVTYRVQCSHGVQLKLFFPWLINIMLVCMPSDEKCLELLWGRIVKNYEARAGSNGKEGELEGNLPLTQFYRDL